MEMSRLVYLFLADGFEEIEALTPVDLLRRAGVEVQTVSVTGKKEVMGSHKIPVICDTTFEEINPEDADVLVIPGGLPGTTTLAAHEGLGEAFKAAAANPEKKVAAICAAPSVLGGLGILNGKRAICFPGWEDKLTGAQIIEGARVVVDDNVTTSRGMGTAFDFGLSLVAQLVSEEKAEELAETTQFS